MLRNVFWPLELHMTLFSLSLSDSSQSERSYSLSGNDEEELNELSSSLMLTSIEFVISKELPSSKNDD